MIYNIWNFGEQEINLPESDIYMDIKNSKGEKRSLGIGDNIQNGNTLVVGTTRTGKTRFVYNMAKKLREQYPDALFVFFDVKKDYLPLYKDGDEVFSFYDIGEYKPFHWSLIEECMRGRDPYDEVREYVEVLFEHQKDPTNVFFVNAAKEIFIAFCNTFIYLLPKNYRFVPSNEEIIRLFKQMTFQQLRNRIALMPGQETICNELLSATANGQPTKIAEGVLAMLRNFITIFSGNFCKKGRDSVDGFMKGEGKAIFLEFDFSRQKSSAAFFRLFLKMLIQKKMSMDTDKEKKIYLFLDETAVLNGDYDLVHAINVGAGDGLRTVVICQSIDHIYMQSPEQFNEHYGMAALAGFSNLIVFRPNDGNTIHAVQEKFGKANMVDVTMPFSRYQQPTVDSKNDYIVQSEDLMSLGLGDAYIKIKESKPQKIHFM